MLLVPLQTGTMQPLLQQHDMCRTAEQKVRRTAPCTMLVLQQTGVMQPLLQEHEGSCACDQELTESEDRAKTMTSMPESCRKPTRIQRSAPRVDIT